MKNKKTGSFDIFFRFLKIMGKPLPLFLFAMVIHMVGDNLFNVTLSVFVKYVVEMAQRGSMDGFWNIFLWCLAAGFASLMVFFVFGAVYDIEAKRGNAKVQKLVTEKALRMPMRYYDEHHSGDIVSKLLNDADVASQIFTSRLRRVTTPVMSVIVYFIPMLLMNYRLALSLLAVNVISLIVNSKYAGPMKAYGTEISIKKKNMTKDISTAASGIGSIKMYEGCRCLCGRFRQDTEEYSDSRVRFIKMGSMLGGINTFFDLTCALGFLFMAIYFVNRDLTTVSSVAAIYTLYGSFSYNFLELGKYLPELMNCIARAQILFEYLDSEEEEGILYQNFDSDRSVRAGDHAVEFKEVDFSYSSGESGDAGPGSGLIYDHLNLKILSGESTAITGETGCGKSTLFKLLLGFYPPSSGEIRVFGEKLTCDNCGKIRQNTVYIPQKSHLFNMSVRENIRLGKPDASDDEVVKAANAHDFIMKLPDGYDTVMENGGGSLSGGERQRIAIARAFIRKAPLLLMDEATSALDNENERLISGAVTKLTEKSTVIIISHKPSTIKSADHIIAI